MYCVLPSTFWEATEGFIYSTTQLGVIGLCSKMQSRGKTIQAKNLSLVKLSLTVVKLKFDQLKRIFQGHQSRGHRRLLDKPRVSVSIRKSILPNIEGFLQLTGYGSVGSVNARKSILAQNQINSLLDGFQKEYPSNGYFKSRFSIEADLEKEFQNLQNILSIDKIPRKNDKDDTTQPTSGESTLVNEVLPQQEDISSMPSKEPACVDTLQENKDNKSGIAHPPKEEEVSLNHPLVSNAHSYLNRQLTVRTDKTVDINNNSSNTQNALLNSAKSQSTNLIVTKYTKPEVYLI